MDLFQNLFQIEISEKQRARIVAALREYHANHPELPEDGGEFNTDHPKSLADMLDDVVDDAVNCFTL